MSTVALGDGVQKAVEILESRSSSYLKCELSFALIEDKNEFKIYYGLIRFLHSRDELPQETSYKYKNLVFKRSIIEAKSGIDLVKKLIEKDEISTDGKDKMLIKPQQIWLPNPLPYISSHSPYGFGYARFGWPSIRISYALVMDQDLQKVIPRGQLVDLDSPLYPDLNQGLADFMKAMRGSGYSLPQSMIDIIIPDFRARIKKVKMSSNKIEAEIESREISNDKLIAKYYIQNNDYESKSSNNIKIENNKVAIPYELEPLYIQINLLEGEKNEDLDNKVVYMKWNLQPWQEIDESAYAKEVTDLIKEGEGERLELKEKLGERFLPTAGAFANTKGGIIALGITDSGEVKGSNEDLNKIKNIIISNFDPPLNFLPKNITYENKNIVVVEIAEGSNKPYVLRERGIFTRKGDRNRQMSRAEFDELFKEKSHTTQLYPAL